MGYGERGTATGRNLNTRMDPEKNGKKTHNSGYFAPDYHSHLPIRVSDWGEMG